MYPFFKKLQKPVKYGIKYGKGLLPTVSYISNKPFSNKSVFLGQTLGLIFFPVLYLLIEPIAKRLPPVFKEKIPLIFYAGFALGSSLGCYLSKTILTNWPTGVTSITCVSISLAIVTVSTVGLTLLYSKIKKLMFGISDEDINADENLLSTDLRQRFLLGVESGLAIGSALGACFEFFIPGSGIIVSALGGVIGTCVGIGVALIGPKLLNKYKKKPADSLISKEPGYFTHITKSLKFGVLLGTCLGIVVGSFILPGLGSVLGGILFAGLGGLITGSSSLATRKLATDSTLYQAGFFTKNKISNATFGMKIGLSAFGLAGALIGTLLLPGVGTLAGCAIGSLIGCALGFLPPLLYSKLSEKRASQKLLTIKEGQEEKAVTLLKQSKLGFSTGSAIGTLIGAAIGSFLPGVGTIVGGLIGGFLGGMIGLAIPTIIKSIQKIKQPPPKLMPQEEFELSIFQENDLSSYCSIQKQASKENLTTANLHRARSPAFSQEASPSQEEIKEEIKRVYRLFKGQQIVLKVGNSQSSFSNNKIPTPPDSSCSLEANTDYILKDNRTTAAVF